MALVVLLRGVNVGGHKTFRPSMLAGELKHLGAVNIGAAGTFVIRQPIGRAQLRAELTRRLPFASEIVTCDGRDIVNLVSRDPFSAPRLEPDMVPFVSVLVGPPRSTPATPVSYPPTGRWLLRVLARENRFVIGVYRRHVKAIGYLGRLDALFGVPVTTRNWNTMTAIARVLEEGGLRRDQRV